MWSNRNSHLRLCVLEVDVDSWKDIEEGQARLVHLMRPVI
jgi:hypothetical protein